MPGDDLLEYDEIQDDLAENSQSIATSNASAPIAADKKGYSGQQIHGFRDFVLKSDLLKAIHECGFEHPSQVQQECVPAALTGADIICQAKAGMGKTAVFVIATLQQIDENSPTPSALALAHTRELAFQISKEYTRFSRHMNGIKISVFYGGSSIKGNQDVLESDPPHIVVGTPGRIKALVEMNALQAKKIKHFILDECDKILSALDMRADVQAIFKATSTAKQVMMFSATMSKEIRPIIKKFCQDPFEIYVNDETKLTLHGLMQYHVILQEKEKNRKLAELLDVLEFNQVVIFVKSGRRAIELNKLLNECNFPSLCIHSGMKQEERIALYGEFKDFKHRILVATDLFGRGIDVERVNIVFNYDMPSDADSYLHRVGRAGRFGTNGLAISFVVPDEENKDKKVLEEVQSRCEVVIGPLPEEIDVSSYMPNN